MGTWYDKDGKAWECDSEYIEVARKHGYLDDNNRQRDKVEPMHGHTMGQTLYDKGCEALYSKGRSTAEAKLARYQIKWGNDVGMDDDYYEEFWDVLDHGRTMSRCYDQQDAVTIVRALNHIDNHKKKP